MTKGHTFLLFVLLAGFILVTQSAFIVEQGYQAMVLQFGEPVKQHTEPGLRLKIPFIQQVKYFNKRILKVDPQPEEVILADQKRLVVDTLARYRIVEMLPFNNALSTEEVARARLANIINSITREVLGNATLADVLSEKRSVLMENIRKQASAAAADKGIEVVDVRIGRADLPEQTSQAIFARMKTERQREAAQFRAEGEQAAQETRAQADKERTVILAEAEKQSQISRGLGDEAAIKIYADAFRQDPEFYAFYRTMQAYRESLRGGDTTLILPSEGDFFRFFKDEQGRQ